MKRQCHLLTTLGCSSSVAIVLALGSSTMANPIDTQSPEPSLPTLSQSDSNPIADALGCGCATCQMSQIQSY